MSEENGADLSVNVAGQQVQIRNVKSLNTLATVATLCVCICGFAVGWFVMEAHSKGQEKKDSDLVTILREMNTTNRELVITQRVTNCLMATPQDRREAAVPTCERIAR